MKTSLQRLVNVLIYDVREAYSSAYSPHSLITHPLSLFPSPLRQEKQQLYNTPTTSMKTNSCSHYSKRSRSWPWSRSKRKMCSWILGHAGNITLNCSCFYKNIHFTIIFCYLESSRDITHVLLKPFYTTSVGKLPFIISRNY